MPRRWLRREREAAPAPPVPPAVRLVPVPASADDAREILAAKLNANPQYQSALRDAESESWGEPGIDGSAMIEAASERRRAAMALPRKVLAKPPPLDRLAGTTMLAVASAPGKVPEEWREAYPLFMAWPHAVEACYAVEMTAAQLRDHLAGREGR
jgi:hypothetical protein